MESWSYASEGKGFMLSDEMVSPTDALSRSRTVLMGWDLKTPCSYKDTMLVPGRETIENQGFMELGFPNIIRKPLHDNLIGGILGGKVSSECVSSTASKVFWGEEESSPRLSNSVVDSNSWDSSLIDLKLGRFGDYRDPQNGKSSKETPVISSAASPVPEKRARSSYLASQTPLCQVHGCNMDLSFSKDYHKRHKVCEVHSKTAKVIVNGIEQRFCQQCSRFHLLVEFDDGKRSCRKRLAGHNERRRKPQLNQSGKNGKLLSSYNGNRFLVSSLPSRTSFICPEIFSSGILQQDKYETSNWSKRVKLEDEAIYRPQSTMVMSNDHLLPKSFLPPFGVEKQYPSFGNGIDTAPGNIFYENSNRYPHELPSPNSVSRSMLWNASSGSEGFNVFDTPSTIQGLSGVSDSGCALSLLSSQAQNSSSYSSGISMARPPIIQGDHAHYNLGLLSEKLLGLGSQASTSLASYRFPSKINSAEVDHVEPIVVSDAANAVNFDVHHNGIFHGPDFVNSKDHLSSGHGTTVDLLQLSSQLQRVERQRQSMQVKRENDAFCYLPIT